MKRFNGKKVITMKDWTDNFDICCSKGDYVEEEIVQEFINCVLPACMRPSCMQCGEPYNHKNGKPTYATFKKVANDTYEYCGHCFCGENKEPI